MFSSIDEEYTKIGVDLRVYDGTNERRGMVYIKNDTGDVYLNYAGPDPLIGNVSFLRSKYNFSTIKMVVDLEEMKYVRCAVMGEEFDIWQYDLNTAADAAIPHLMFGTQVYSGSVGGTYYIDNIVLTENEPI